MNTQYLNQLKNKNIAILGFGREGKSLVNFFKEHDFQKITIFDQNLVIDKSDYTHIEIKNFTFEKFKDFDLIYLSPGISPYQNKLLKLNLSSLTDLFFNLYKEIKKIGITGTKGKSTTASLITHSLKKLNKNVSLAGNIGVPLLEIENVENLDYLVIELSSYQLFNFKHSLDYAIFINLYEEHLSWHQGFENYKNDKLNLIKFANKNSTILINDECSSFLNKSDAKIITFSEKETPIETSKLVTRTLLENLNFNENQITKSLKNFNPLEHRIQELGYYKKNILIIDDSLATIPKAVIASCKNYPNKEIILLMGGLDRGISYKEIIKLPKNVIKIICFGEITKKLSSILDKSKIEVTNNFQSAIELSKKIANENQIILFSPGAPSSPPFKNYVERSTFLKNQFF